MNDDVKLTSLKPNPLEGENLPPPPSARGKNRELWAGFFVILGLGTALGLLFTLTDASMFRGRYVVSTVINDAGGIRRGDPVQMRGVNIGRVQRFRIVPTGVEVHLEIEGEYSIPADSRVVLKSSGLLGGMVADVLPGNSPQNLKGGGVLPGSISGGLKDTAANLADSAEVVMKRMQAALSERTTQNLEESSVQLNQLLKNTRDFLAEEKKNLNALMQTLRRSADGVEKITNRPELEQSIVRLDALLKKMEKTSISLDRSSASLEVVLGRVERGEGTLGKLTKDEALYTNLNEATLDLKKLLEDIRRQPKRYLKLSIF